MELIKEGVNLTFEFRDDELEAPPKFTFEPSMVLIFTRAALDEFHPLFLFLAKALTNATSKLPP